MFRKVLVGVDGRPGGRDAIALAKLLAPEPARFLLANVYGGDDPLGRDAGPTVATERMQAADLLDRERSAAHIDAQMLVCDHGAPGRALRGIAEQKAADLLVVGSCHRGAVGRVLLGNDTLRALNGTTCAVAVAPRWFAVGPDPLATIGVAYNGSAESEFALEAARTLAGAAGAKTSGTVGCAVAAGGSSALGSPRLDGGDRADDQRRA